MADSMIEKLDKRAIHQLYNFGQFKWFKLYDDHDRGLQKKDRQQMYVKNEQQRMNQSFLSQRKTFKSSGKAN